MTNETKLAVILHADVVGSTDLVQRDERLAHERIRDAFRRFSETVSVNGGTPHEIRGDALVAEFERASDAANAALAFQAENQANNEVFAGEILPELRIGIAMGEVIIADGTVTGAGVVLAQRLEQLAAPSGVCISAAVREALPRRLLFDYGDLGEQILKGFDRPQRAYEVSLSSGDGPAKHTRYRRSPQFGVERASVAVLPFDNLSSDPEQEFFADGMAEDIITALSKFKELFVIARNTTFTFKGEAVDVTEVAKQLHVRYVLEGSVRRAGNRIRVTAQLIDAEDGSHIWADRYDRDLKDIFEVQDEVTESIVVAIAPTISRTELARARRHPWANLDAWGRYQVARSVMQTHDRRGFEAAIELLREVIRNDPQTSAAHGWLAYAMYCLGLLYDQDRERNFQEGQQIAERGIVLDPDEPQNYVSLARLLTASGEWMKAIAFCESAIRLNPNFANAHVGLGWALHVGKGDAEASLRHFETGLRLNPKDPWRFTTESLYSSALRTLGRYEEAVIHSRAACAPGVEGFLPYMHLASNLGHSGAQLEAQQAAAKALEMEPRFTVKFAHNMFSKVHASMRDALLEGLRKAGVSEG